MDPKRRITAVELAASVSEPFGERCERSHHLGHSSSSCSSFSSSSSYSSSWSSSSSCSSYSSCSSSS
ncbi:hypothetical protein GJ632_16605 [Halogeometricum sp. CBA1124]|nr:hypothetical protein [Halogeometricum sp. CBA1124]